jgi:hypothetical protein
LTLSTLQTYLKRQNYGQLRFLKILDLSIFWTPLDRPDKIHTRYRFIPFFDYPPEIRKVIYTTNAIESVNMSLRKITKNFGSFPSDEALSKLFYLALRNISQKWNMPIRDWKAALNRFSIEFEDRVPHQ